LIGGDRRFSFTVGGRDPVRHRITPILSNG
jgi:hypothetical protein